MSLHVERSHNHSASQCLGHVPFCKTRPALIWLFYQPVAAALMSGALAADAPALVELAALGLDLTPLAPSSDLNLDRL